MENAIKTAVNAGVTVVAASGNNGVNNDLHPFYPASYNVKGLISVGASNHKDALASFSNYGATSVDLVAPGEDVVGGFPPNIWITWSGTSFAAPKVAGVAALIKSARPALNAVQVEAVLIGAVDVLFGLSGKVASGGRLNAGSAVAGPQPGDPNDEQFFYRASDGLFLYYDVNSSGKLTSLLRSGKYSAGWSSIMAINLDG
jgi:subtilisin family serine protease